MFLFCLIVLPYFTVLTFYEVVVVIFRTDMNGAWSGMESENRCTLTDWKTI